eukprot:m.117975 g.117975  ORF g.117975 m.117975 type:complete len:457 (+) comp16111_c0_seq2:40-1410(+)
MSAPTASPASASAASAAASGGGGPATLPFVCGNPDIAVKRGHLDLVPDRSKKAKQRGTREDATVCLQNIPCSINAMDLLVFLETAREHIRLTRLLNSVDPQFYMAILRFDKPEAASAFIANFKGRQLDLLDSAVCDPVIVYGVHEQDAPAQTQGAETCAICLDALPEDGMDAVMIQCKHSFHATCLSKCLELTCPVCRYTHNRVSEVQCQQCDVREGLWMCLTCGFVGCGRRQWFGDSAHVHSNSHALLHFESTSHPYAQNMQTQRVWDYRQDRYTYRLSHDVTSNKLVEVPSPRTAPSHSEGLSEEDTQDALALEYTFLLTQQLESQREAFTRNLHGVQEHWAEQRKQAEQRRNAAAARHSELTQALLSTTASLSAATKRSKQTQLEVAKTLAAAKEEASMLATLENNIKDWHRRLASEDEARKAVLAKEEKVIAQLEEQLQELSLKLDGPAAPS